MNIAIFVTDDVISMLTNLSRVQLETITKLSETHNTVDEIGSRSSKMEEIKRKEMKQVRINDYIF